MPVARAPQRGTAAAARSFRRHQMMDEMRSLEDAEAAAAAAKAAVVAAAAAAAAAATAASEAEAKLVEMARGGGRGRWSNSSLKQSATLRPPSSRPRRWQQRAAARARGALSSSGSPLCAGSLAVLVCHRSSDNTDTAAVEEFLLRRACVVFTKQRATTHPPAVGSGSGSGSSGAERSDGKRKLQLSSAGRSGSS